MEDTKLYFPGQDYPDREEWLAKRETPKGSHRSLFYNPRKLVPVTQDGRGGVLQGQFNPGVNKLKAVAKKDPAVRKQLLELRRKAQLQGHITIDKQMGANPSGR